MLDKFTIVKLTKPKYDQEQVTVEDPTPRVLIIRTYSDSRQYLVRYPNNFIHRVNEDDVLTKGQYPIDHLSYTDIAGAMRAVEVEYRRNEVYKAMLQSGYPKFAIDLNQRIEAKHRAHQEKQQAPAVTVQDIVTVPVLPVAEDTNTTDLTITLLKSIDSKLETLIQLWGGTGNGQ